MNWEVCVRHLLPFIRGSDRFIPQVAGVVSEMIILKTVAKLSQTAFCRVELRRL